MKYAYLIDLLDPECYLSVSQLFEHETGELAEDQRIISLPEGPNEIFDFTDTIMYRTAKYHEHSVGWETFFITTGCCELTVGGKTCLLEPGDIIHVQPWQAHQMHFPKPTVYRGIFHGINMSGSVMSLAYISKVNPDLMRRRMTPEGRYLMRRDNIIRETPVSVFVPKEEVSAARTPDKPLNTFELDGVVMKQYTGRWENNGISELWKAEMVDGFTVEFHNDNPNADMFYITEGNVKFTVAGEEFIAYHDCLVKIPKFTPRAFTAQGPAVMYDLAGMTHWLDLLEDAKSIKMNAPERWADKEVIADLKERNKYYVEFLGIRK